MIPRFFIDRPIFAAVLSVLSFAGMLNAARAFSPSNPPIWWACSPSAVAWRAMDTLAAPVSYCVQRLGLPVALKLDPAHASISRGTFFTHFRLFSDRQSKAFWNVSGSRARSHTR